MSIQNDWKKCLDSTFHQEFNGLPTFTGALRPKMIRFISKLIADARRDMSNSTQNDVEKYQKRIEMILGVSSKRTRTYKFRSYKTIDGRSVEGRTVTAKIPTNPKVKKLLTLIADARREVIEKVETLLCTHNYSSMNSEDVFNIKEEIRYILATLKEEEK